MASHDKQEGFEPHDDNEASSQGRIDFASTAIRVTRALVAEVRDMERREDQLRRRMLGSAPKNKTEQITIASGGGAQRRQNVPTSNERQREQEETTTMLRLKDGANDDRRPDATTTSGGGWALGGEVPPPRLVSSAEHSSRSSSMNSGDAAEERLPPVTPLDLLQFVADLIHLSKRLHGASRELRAARRLQTAVSLVPRRSRRGQEGGLPDGTTAPQHRPPQPATAELSERSAAPPPVQAVGVDQPQDVPPPPPPGTLILEEEQGGLDDVTPATAAVAGSSAAPDELNPLWHPPASSQTPHSNMTTNRQKKLVTPSALHESLLANFARATAARAEMLSRWSVHSRSRGTHEDWFSLLPRAAATYHRRRRGSGDRAGHAEASSDRSGQNFSRPSWMSADVLAECEARRKELQRESLELTAFLLREEGHLYDAAMAMEDALALIALRDTADDAYDPGGSMSGRERPRGAVPPPLRPQTVLNYLSVLELAVQRSGEAASKLIRSHQSDTLAVRQIGWDEGGRGPPSNGSGSADTNTALSSSSWVAPLLQSVQGALYTPNEQVNGPDGDEDDTAKTEVENRGANEKVTSSGQHRLPRSRDGGLQDEPFDHPSSSNVAMRVLLERGGTAAHPGDRMHQLGSALNDELSERFERVFLGTDVVATTLLFVQGGAAQRQRYVHQRAALAYLVLLGRLYAIRRATVMLSLYCDTWQAVLHHRQRQSDDDDGVNMLTSATVGLWDSMSIGLRGRPIPAIAASSVRRATTTTTTTVAVGQDAMLGEWQRLWASTCHPAVRLYLSQRIVCDLAECAKFYQQELLFGGGEGDEEEFRAGMVGDGDDEATRTAARLTRGDRDDRDQSKRDMGLRRADDDDDDVQNGGSDMGSLNPTCAPAGDWHRLHLVLKGRIQEFSRWLAHSAYASPQESAMFEGGATSCWKFQLRRARQFAMAHPLSFVVHYQGTPPAAAAPLQSAEGRNASSISTAADRDDFRAARLGGGPRDLVAPGRRDELRRDKQLPALATLYAWSAYSGGVALLLMAAAAPTAARKPSQLAAADERAPMRSRERRRGDSDFLADETADNNRPLHEMNAPDGAAAPLQRSPLGVQPTAAFSKLALTASSSRQHPPPSTCGDVDPAAAFARLAGFKVRPAPTVAAASLDPSQPQVLRPSPAARHGIVAPPAPVRRLDLSSMIKPKGGKSQNDVCALSDNAERAANPSRRQPDDDYSRRPTGSTNPAAARSPTSTSVADDAVAGGGVRPPPTQPVAAGNDIVEKGTAAPPGEGPSLQPRSAPSPSPAPRPPRSAAGDDADANTGVVTVAATTTAMPRNATSGIIMSVRVGVAPIAHPPPLGPPQEPPRTIGDQATFGNAPLSLFADAPRQPSWTLAPAPSRQPPFLVMPPAPRVAPRIVIGAEGGATSDSLDGGTGPSTRVAAGPYVTSAQVAPAPSSPSQAPAANEAPPPPPHPGPTAAPGDTSTQPRGGRDEPPPLPPPDTPATPVEDKAPPPTAPSSRVSPTTAVSQNTKQHPPAAEITKPPAAVNSTTVVEPLGATGTSPRDGGKGNAHHLVVRRSPCTIVDAIPPAAGAQGATNPATGRLRTPPRQLSSTVVATGTRISGDDAEAAATSRPATRLQTPPRPRSPPVRREGPTYNLPKSQPVANGRLQTLPRRDTTSPEPRGPPPQRLRTPPRPANTNAAAATATAPPVAKKAVRIQTPPRSDETGRHAAAAAPDSERAPPRLQTPPRSAARSMTGEASIPETTSQPALQPATGRTNESASLTTTEEPTAPPPTPQPATGSTRQERPSPPETTSAVPKGSENDAVVAAGASDKGAAAASAVAPQASDRTAWRRTPTRSATTPPRPSVRAESPSHHPSPQQHQFQSPPATSAANVSHTTWPTSGGDGAAAACSSSSPRSMSKSQSNQPAPPLTEAHPATKVRRPSGPTTPRSQEDAEGAAAATAAPPPTRRPPNAECCTVLDVKPAPARRPAVAQFRLPSD